MTTDNAKMLGSLAFANGKPCAPCMDTAMMEADRKSVV